MPKKTKILFLLLLCPLLFVQPIFAQEKTEQQKDASVESEESKAEENTEEENQEIEPIITSEGAIFVEKKILFDASDSVLLNIPAQVSYIWKFDDGTSANGKEVLHSFKKTGKHKVELTIQQGAQIKAAEKEIFIYDKKVLLITDSDKQSGLELITEQAADNGVFLKMISVTEEETGFLTEEKLVQIIKENSEFINTADVLIFHTKTSLGLQSFTRYWQLAETKPDLKNKLVVKISDESMLVASKIAQQNFDVITPNYILLTRKEALNPIFETKDYTKIVENLKSRGIEYQIIDERTERSRFFILSNWITNFIANGIPANTIYLILAIPFITFIIAFARQVVGISTFGVYTPTVLALTFLILGIYFGLGALLIVVFVSYMLRLVLQRIELLYTPRLSLALSTISLSLLAIIWFLIKFGSPISIPLAIFPLIVMSTMSEKFTAAQSEEGLRGALFGAFQTILVAVAAYYLVIWTAFSNLLMYLPELIFVPLAGNILLGKFTGLRLTEYFRFRALFKEHTEE
ncbi:MAG: 7TM domain-containing protein [bacterium]